MSSASRKNQGGGGFARKRQPKQDATAGTGPAARRHHHGPIRESLAMLWMMGIDDHTRFGIDATPQTQPLIAEQDPPTNPGGHDKLSHHVSHFVRTADRTSLANMPVSKRLGASDNNRCRR
jgi:hypothetical protein